MSDPYDIAEPKPSVRWLRISSDEKRLQQLFIVTRRYSWGEVIEMLEEWRDVPTVTEN